MKKIILTMAMAILAMVSFAQIPQTFSYQGVVRDADNKLVADKQVTVSVQILQGADDGTAVYSETHEVTTNANGLMTFELGSKDAENFAKIDWSNAPYFVKTVAEFDGKQISGVTPLLAVPYALYAAKAGNADVDLSEYAKKTELPETVDLSEYYKKSDVDNLLSELTAKVTKLDKQLNPPIPGTIEFAFSVSADKKVYFSQGNLQYQASTNTWRFAEHQYDMVGDANANISSSNTGWIDLFGWGTSGYNSIYPYSNDNYAYAFEGESTDIAGTNYDWGLYNKISNGGNQSGQWRTLTNSEWNYVISNRTDARYLRGTATVNGVNGIVLLPDNWLFPSDIEFKYGENSWSQNTYSASEWSKMEANGAVFLPAAGRRDGTGVDRVGSYGYYCSSSARDSYGAYCLRFGSGGVDTSDGNGRYGRSVRLVQEVEE